jgi:hypothetical protein
VSGTNAEWYCEGCESLQGGCSKLFGIYLCESCRRQVWADIARDHEEQGVRLSPQDIQEAIALEARGVILFADPTIQEWVN